MDEYKQLPQAADMKRCCMCHRKLAGGDSPWSLCFDPQYEHNVWGGDTHEYVGMLCQKCVEGVTSGIAKSWRPFAAVMWPLVVVQILLLVAAYGLI